MANQTIFLPFEHYPFFMEAETAHNMNILEISTRSQNPFGKSMSPFNLQITLKSGRRVKVECAYQGSKVFKDNEQYPDIYWGTPRDAALDKRVKGRAPEGFNFFGKAYSPNPKHSFFNFLYIIALFQRKDDVYGKLSEFDGYTDMFYSPRKDVNCQARAAAQYVSMMRQGLINKDTSSAELYQLLLGDVIWSVV